MADSKTTIYLDADDHRRRGPRARTGTPGGTAHSRGSGRVRATARGAVCSRFASLELGLVDAVVIAVAERLRAEAIVTLDLHDFGAVKIAGAPRLLPRDGGA